MHFSWGLGFLRGCLAFGPPLADTIRSFEEICDGKWDHLPEQAFMYVGSIEQAEEQAKKMQEKK
mgnify:CR=1 FL=1